MPTEEKRVLYLDAIRAIAVCLIIIFHFNHHALTLAVSDHPIFWSRGELNHGFLGNLGVSLFIILSGASLMLSTKEKFNIKLYVKKRFLAIFPLFWVSYASLFLVLFLLHHKFPANGPPLTFLLTVIGMDGFLVFAIPNFYLIGEWFLGCIIILYLIFPLLRFLLLKYSFLTGLLCLCITLLIGKYYHMEMTIDRVPLFRLSEFLFGMSFIFLFQRSSIVLNIFLCGLSALLFYVTFSLHIPYPFALLLQGAFIFTCLASIAEITGNMLFAKAITFLSTYSYGAFLVHHIVFIEMLPFFKDRHISIIGDYMLFLVLLIAIFSLSFLLTGATAFGLRRIGKEKWFLSPMGERQ